jgi:acetyl-CoA carboxylase biotin carboxyl carrier protein
MPEGDKKTGTHPDKDLIRSVWEEARELIKRLEGSTVQRLAVQAGEYKIEIERGTAPPVIATGAGGGPTLQPEKTAEPVAPEVDHGHPIRAPLVGTFYRASEPGSKPFVEEGDVVDPGQTVAIVEAMKIMNQVTADQGGKVAQILATDGDWVEFEQVLMYLEPPE